MWSKFTRPCLAPFRPLPLPVPSGRRQFPIWTSFSGRNYGNSREIKQTNSFRVLRAEEEEKKEEDDDEAGIACDGGGSKNMNI